MKLKNIYFDKVNSGEKIYEIRLNDEKRKLINIGDMIVFKKEPLLVESVNAKVVELLYFASFEEMAKCLPLESIGFENKTIDYVVSVYHQFYSEDDEKKYGILAIKLDIDK